MPHRFWDRHPDTGEAGIYLEQELAVGTLWIPKSAFPALRGGSQAQRIANFESDMHAMLDPLTGVQRIRIHVIDLVPLNYIQTIFSSDASIPANWWEIA